MVVIVREEATTMIMATRWHLKGEGGEGHDGCVGCWWWGEGWFDHN